jgi:hypothetical protein
MYAETQQRPPAQHKCAQVEYNKICDHDSILILGYHGGDDQSLMIYDDDDVVVVVSISTVCCCCCCCTCFILSGAIADGFSHKSPIILLFHNICSSKDSPEMEQTHCFVVVGVVSTGVFGLRSSFALDRIARHSSDSCAIKSERDCSIDAIPALSVMSFQ